MKQSGKKFLFPFLYQEELFKQWEAGLILPSSQQPTPQRQGRDKGNEIGQIWREGDIMEHEGRARGVREHHGT